MNLKNRFPKVFLSSFIAVIFLDQITKILALKYLEYLKPVNICCGDLIRLTLMYNTGGAFSILSHTPFLFFIISTIAFIFLIVAHIKAKYNSFLYFLSTGLIFGGAVGNMIDRIRLGKVIDFIDIDIPDIVIHKLGYALYRWPAFNIADASITIGALLLLISIEIIGKKEKN